MKEIKRRELIDKFFSFFRSKGHSIISSASVFPENDPTVLFTTAGMHPLVPYLLGETHPEGKRLCSIQKCIRTSDIDEIGDDSHLTFFEMLGNWSLGDYFKEEMIPWSYEFLTSSKYLNLNKDKLSFTCFLGNDKAPKDVQSYDLWVKCGVKENKISFLPQEDNWWETGSGSGPCGPDSEMFYSTTNGNLEIWNDVFMQYEVNNGVYTSLRNKNVDTGMGVERTITVLNNYNSVYDTEIFLSLRLLLEKLTNKKYDDNKKAFRIIMDHIRTSTFILGDDKALVPGNTSSGYVLRRLIRRMIRYIKSLDVKCSILESLSNEVINYYKDDYEELSRNKEFIIKELLKEETRFNKTINSGYKMFDKVTKNLVNNVIDGDSAFKLFDTFGFPLEFTLEMAHEKQLEVDIEGFNKKLLEHQEKSRTASAGEFKGGLADDSYKCTCYHTLAHICLAVLKKMYGDTVIQKGSNITGERLRYDFSLDRKMSDEEKESFINSVNEIISKNYPVIKEEMSYKDAVDSGAEGIFNDKYGSSVSVYTISNVSKEICGGPHVKNAGELGVAKLIKEESSSSGVRRIKVILEELK
ncbi:MAG: alanine--tRNA ligase [Bacilli bacterium]